MIVGFTGTQKGMTALQYLAVTNLFDQLDVDEFHHGDCLGADQDAHDIANDLSKKIVIHPPLNARARAFCSGTKTSILAAKEYLARNHDIVEASEVMIATPGEFKEQLRSGTWATIRWARRLKRRLYIVFPDGSYSNA